ncbi:MAG TPA: hypothetical protein VF785_23525 [Gemmatimonadaceae bacterium]
MRTITDAAGVEWTVFEVRRDGQTTDQWSYLPEEFGDGWLCFESQFSKRRLTPVPADWQQFGQEDLVSMLHQATPVRRTQTSSEDRSTAE